MTPTAASTSEIKVAAEPVKPIMKEADVALTHAAQRVQTREPNQRPPQRKTLREERNVALHEPPPAPEVAPAHVPVSTVRTDFPY